MQDPYLSPIGSQCAIPKCRFLITERNYRNICAHHQKTRFRAGSATASRHFIDYDYVHKLSPKERAWLYRFTDEFYKNSFKKTRRLHHTKALRRAAIAADTARRKSVESLARIIRLPNPSTPALLHSPLESKNPLDALVEYIDAKRSTNTEK